MPSPFPGMDPYLEAPKFWGGFHTRLCNKFSESLNAVLPDGYYAEMDEYVWLQEEQSVERERLGKPDTFIADQNGTPKTAATGKSAVATMPSPVYVSLPQATKRKHRFVKIVGPDDLTVVTVIEILSPANKLKGEERNKYLDKRDEYLGTGTNLVEIDLLRDGGRMPFGEPSPEMADYYVFVCRKKEYPRAEVWPFTVRDPIPTIPVPLKAEDGDLPLDLQRSVTAVYDLNRYARRIDYAEWAAELLHKHARKGKKKAT